MAAEAVSALLTPLVDEDPFGPAPAPRTQAPAPAPVPPMEPGKPIVLTLPYPISANRYWTQITLPAAKGSKTGKQRILNVPSREAKAYKDSVGWLARAAGIRTPFTWRIAMEIELYPHRPQDWQRRQRLDPIAWDDSVQCIDLGNCEKVLADALQGIVYEDDRWIWVENKRRMLPDEKGARVVVTVTPLARPAHPQETLL